MTLPPERIGDRGQRYVVQAKGWPDEAQPRAWQNCAYFDTIEGADKAAAALASHPCVEETRVRFRFEVGDEVWWHVPTVMDFCNTWAPDITRPTKIIAVETRAGGGTGHPQMVRVSPNYCPHGDQFDASWFLPVGVTDHNQLHPRLRRPGAFGAR